MKVMLSIALILALVGGSSCNQATSAGRLDPHPEALKTLVQRFHDEAWNRGEMAVIEELFSPQYTRHDPGTGTTTADHDDQRRSAGSQRTMFPDLRLHVDFMIAEGDRVAARWTIEGTNTGPRGKSPATGKAVKFSGINIFRFQNGKVVELWNHRDDLSVTRQLSATPTER